MTGFVLADGSHCLTGIITNDTINNIPIANPAATGAAVPAMYDKNIEYS
jgi:hypothetical protein